MRRILSILLLFLAACSVPPVAGIAPTVTAQPTATAVQATAAPTPTPYPATPTAAICTVETGYDNGTVNVRAGAGMSYTVVDVVRQGETMVLVGPVIDGWQHVTTQKLVEGWFYVEGWCK